MIAYKAFRSYESGKLYPIWVDEQFEPYPLGYTHIPADGCGPFACFKSFDDATDFTFSFAYSIIHKVKIKESSETKLWMGNVMMWGVSSKGLPKGTILADEFEILEEVK